MSNYADDMLSGDGITNLPLEKLNKYEFNTTDEKGKSIDSGDIV